MAEKDPATGKQLEWVPPPYISDIFFKYKCIKVDIARALNIHRQTLYHHLKTNPELKALFDEVERSLDNEWIDQSERVIWQLLAQAKDRPNQALKAAMYVLDHKGKHRNWGPQPEDKSAQQKVVFEVNYKHDSNNPIEILSQALSDPDTTSPQ